MALPLPADDSLPIRLGTPIGPVSPLVRQLEPLFVAVDDLIEIVLLDEVLGPDTLRAELSGPNPSADRFGIPADPPGGFRHGQHVVAYYSSCPSRQTRPRFLLPPRPRSRRRAWRSGWGASSS